MIMNYDVIINNNYNNDMIITVRQIWTIFYSDDNDGLKSKVMFIQIDDNEANWLARRIRVVNSDCVWMIEYI